MIYADYTAIWQTHIIQRVTYFHLAKTGKQTQTAHWSKEQKWNCNFNHIPIIKHKMYKISF